VKRLPAAGVTVLALLLILGFAVADYHTTVRMNFAALYLLLIGVVGWRAGKWPSIVVSLCSLAALNAVFWTRQQGPLRFEWLMAWNIGVHLIAFVGVGWVTAGLQRAHRGLRESERKYRQLHETMMDAFASVDLKGRILDSNRAFQTLLCYTGEELRSRSYQDLTPEKWHEREARIVAEQVLPRGYSEVYEKEYRRKDGAVFPVELRTFLVRGNDGDPVAMWAIVRNVTERHQAADALRPSRDLLEARVRERTAELEAANAALRQSEERYRSLVHNLNVGVFRNTPGPAGRFLEANPALARIHGYDSVDELLQVKVADLYQWPEERMATMQDLLRSGKVLDQELRLKRRDGHPIYAAVSATSHLGADGQIEWIDGVLEDVTERRRLERQILEISDDEQARIGQDLHDGLCQELVGLAFDANSLVADLEQAGRPERAKAVRMAAGLDRAITEARHLARGLFPVRLEGTGLGPALEQLVQGAGERFEVRCRFEQVGEVTVPGKLVATQLYRIAQEALSNAVRHSRGKNVCLRLAREGAALLLQVEDDGIGLSPHQTSSGMGVHIIRYRARSIGASFSIDPRACGGTVVTCRLAGTSDPV
jgi:PAS domain S-box-containing protein